MKRSREDIEHFIMNEHIITQQTFVLQANKKD